MTNKEKAKLYEPQKWALYINGNFHGSYSSHAAAKIALHFKKKESYDNCDNNCDGCSQNNGCGWCIFLDRPIGNYVSTTYSTTTEMLTNENKI